jgi:hypothetical protein
MSYFDNLVKIRRFVLSYFDNLVKISTKDAKSKSYFNEM